MKDLQPREGEDGGGGRLGEEADLTMLVGRGWGGGGYRGGREGLVVGEVTVVVEEDVTVLVVEEGTGGEVVLA